MTTVDYALVFAGYALQDMATAVFYRLATYAVNNLIDDAAMLFLVFV